MLRSTLFYIIFLLIPLTASARISSLQQSNSLSFIENKGQVTDQYYKPRTDIQFKLAATAGLNIFISSGAIHYQWSKQTSKGKNENPKDKLLLHTLRTYDSGLRTDMYRMDVELIGANKNAEIITEQKQDYYENYYTSSMGDNGVTVYAYSKITYKNIYPNIDWVLSVNNSLLKHEFIVRPGGNPADIKLKYNGHTSLSIGKDGDIEAISPVGSVTEQAPICFTENGTVVASSFQLDRDILSYNITNYTGTLVIDPNLVWATYYGGNGIEEAHGGITDSAGNTYLTGCTSSIINIATVGAYQTALSASNYWDAFLVKFNNFGQRQWGTYYGGLGEDIGLGVSSDFSGNIYLTGITSSTSGIASPSAYQSIYGGGTHDAFLVKFSNSGQRKWATYYGGSGWDVAYKVVTDSVSNVYITGTTASISGITSSGTYQPSYGGGDADAFLTKFDSSGQKQWSTYYGSSGNDTSYALAIDLMNNIYIAGRTTSTSGIVSPGAFQVAYGGGTFDAFLVKFNDLGQRQWATYYGGTDYDAVYGLFANALGDIIITGCTGSTSNIASTGAYQDTYGSNDDAFLAEFDSTGQRLWATYYGGTGLDVGIALAGDTSGNIYLAGYTASPTGIASPGAYQVSYGGNNEDAFLAKFNNSGQRLWATYYGGSNTDAAFSVGVDANRNIFLAGSSASISGIATSGAYQDTLEGGIDDFLAKFDSSSGNVSINNFIPATNDIQIYPNPITSIVHIQSPTTVNLRVSSIEGKPLIEKQNAKEINISSLPTGTYFFSIYDNNTGLKLKTEQLVKLSD